jgi:hypothetical protein
VSRAPARPPAPSPPRQHFQLPPHSLASRALWPRPHSRRRPSLAGCGKSFLFYNSDRNQPIFMSMYGSLDGKVDSSTYQAAGDVTNLDKRFNTDCANKLFAVCDEVLSPLCGAIPTCDPPPRLALALLWPPPPNSISPNLPLGWRDHCQQAPLHSQAPRGLQERHR